MSRQAIVAIAAVLIMAPVAFADAHDNCGWCGADAQALGRALNMGAPVPCYCPPPSPQPKRDPPVRAKAPDGGPPAKAVSR